MSPNMVGALLMMASMAAFTINDSFLKMTDGAVPLFQLLFLRGIITVMLILVFRKQLGRISFDVSRRDWAVIGVRSFGEIAAAYFFLSALFHMPLANVSAIMQVLPLALTLASAVILREAVGWRRMSAIAVGFFGVMLIVKPGAEGFNIWSVYALIAVACVTLRDLATRQLSPGVPSMTVTMVTALSVMVAAGLASLTDQWAPITPSSGMLIAGSGLLVLGGYYTSIQVMRTGEVSFTAPFRYTSLIWALILGWFIFGDWPGVWTLIGAVIVVATGIFTLYRESKVRASA